MAVVTILTHLLWLAVVLALSGPRSAHAQAGPATDLVERSRTLRDWIKDTSSVRLQAEQPGSAHRLDDVFDWHEITRRMLRTNWANLPQSWERRFTSAVRLKLIREVSFFLLRYGSGLNEEALRWSEEATAGDKAWVTLNILANDEIQSARFRVLRGRGRWRIFDIRTEQFNLIAEHLNPFDNLLEEGFSYEYVEARLLDVPELRIDDFSQALPGDYPRYWGWRKKDDGLMRTDPLYSVRSDSGQSYLTSRSSSVAVPLVRPFSYDLTDYRRLSWKWRIRYTGDRGGMRGSLATVSVLFYQNWIGVPVMLHYVWHSDARPCTVLKKEGWLFDSYYVVLRSGPGEAGEWKEETIEPFRDFVTVFGHEPPPRLTAVALLTGEQMTGLEVDYDDLIARRPVSALSCP